MTSSDLYSDEDYASTVLYSPQDGDIGHDIFFVHGLNGHPLRTWTHKNGCFWPRDLLPAAEGFHTSRIISLGYNSKVSGRGATSQSIFDHARGMLADIRGFRRGVTARPILFVAHGVGGNILKEVLITSFREDVPERDNIARSTTAIVFFATPQQGSPLMNNVYRSAQMLRLAGLSTARRLVKQLRPGSDYIYESSIGFNVFLKAVRVKIISLYGSLPVQVGILKMNYLRQQDVLVGNVNEDCLSLERTPFDIQKIIGNTDPHYKRILDLMLPLMGPPCLIRPPEGPRKSSESAPDTEHSESEHKKITALESGLLNVVITGHSIDLTRDWVETTIAALLDRNGEANLLSREFMNESFPGKSMDNDRVTLTFRPARGGVTQTRHFEVRDHIPHPMIIAGGGFYSLRRQSEAISGYTFGETDSTLSPSVDDSDTQISDPQQAIPHVVPAISNQRRGASPMGSPQMVSPPEALLASSPETQEDMLSSIQNIARNTGSGILASSGQLARNMTAAGESSSKLGLSTGTAVAAAGISTIGTANAVVGTAVAYGSRSQATRSANIAQKSLNLNRRIFKYNKKKDAKDAARTNSAGGVKPSDSESHSDLESDSDSEPDSGNVHSGVGGSSSKSPSLRATRGRPAVPSAVTRGRAQRSSPDATATQREMGDGDLSVRPVLTSSPTLLLSGPSSPPGRPQPHEGSVPVPVAAQELDIIFPAVPTHSFNARPPAPEDTPIQLVDGLSIEMDELSSLRDEEVMLDPAEQPQPGVYAYSHGYSTANAAAPSAEDSKVSKERQGILIMKGDSMMTNLLPITPMSDVLQTGSKAKAIEEANNIYGASDHLSLQQDSTSSPNEQQQVQESEPELKPQIETLPQQLEHQNSGMSSVAEFRQGSGSIFNTAAEVAIEKQDDPGISTCRRSTGHKSIASTGSEPAALGGKQLLMTASDDDMSRESAKKDEQEFEVEDNMIEESQITRAESEGNMGEANEVEDEQVKHPGVNANSKEAGETTITGDPEASLLGLYGLGRAHTV